MVNLNKYINAYLAENNESKMDVVKKMGYKNIAKGLRRLEVCLKHGISKGDFLQKLAHAMDVNIRVITEAVLATKNEIRYEEFLKVKENFNCHIKIQHELVKPTNITAVAFLGVSRFKEIQLSVSITENTLWEQIEIVREIIQQHFDNQNGKCPLFGRITGYRFYYQYDEWVEFSVDGEIIGYYTGENKRTEAVLKIGSKKITGGLFK